MDVGVVGVRNKQGPYMPTMQISGRGFGLGLCFASSQTFRINRSIMAREGRIASNRCHPMAVEVKFDSDTFPLMAGEQRIVSHRKSLMSRAAKVASNGKEMGERNVYKQANYQQVRHMHDNHRPAKVSEEKCIDVSEGRCFEVIVSGPGHTHSKVLRAGFVEQKYSQDPNSMSSGCLVGQNYYQQPSRVNRRWVVRRNYSQQPNITRSRWVSEQNSSRQSGSMNSRLESGRPSFNPARMGEWNMSRNVVIQDFPSKGNEIQELYTDSKISVTKQKSESNCHQTPQDKLDWNRAIQGIREKTSLNCMYVAETQLKHNYKVDVSPSLKKQPQSEDVSVEKQEREPQCTIKTDPIHSSSRPFESAEKSKHYNRERVVGDSKDVSVEKQEQETQGSIKSGPIHSSRRSIGSAEKSKHDNMEKRVGERKDNASQVCASDKVTSEISESKGGNIHSSSRPFESAEKSKHDNRERGVCESKDVSVKNQEQEAQGTIKSGPIHSSSRSIESAEKAKHDNREKGVGESKDNATQVSASDKVAAEISESKGGNFEDRLKDLFKQVLVVTELDIAKRVVGKLMGEYRNLVHACDTEVAGINVKKESPVDHGKLICFSIYCGSNADFADGKSCVWVDVLDGDKDVLSVFAPYFEDSSIRKVFHNYSFDRHIIKNHGINVCGFYADTMHLARLWNSARREEGGYSLESLTKDPKVMDGIGMAGQDQMIEGKLSMKALFGKNKVRKDGSEGKTITIAPVEKLQRSITERDKWICYSALDSMSTWKLWKSLQTKLKDTEWTFQEDSKRTMYDFYEEYWRPFGDLLVKMESKGMLVDREYLSKKEKEAKQEQEKSASWFTHWASSYCPDAKYMNVGSDTQVRQLLFGGMPNKKDPNQSLPVKRTIKVPNVDNFIDQGKKAPLKLRNIELHGLGVNMEVEQYTVSGWPSVSSAALKVLAGKVAIDYEDLAEESENEFTEDLDDALAVLTSSGVKNADTTIENKEGEDISVYGTAYSAFGGGETGRRACQAIAALCEVNSINTLISNFLLPLQGEEISGKDGRVHCSLNINTETGRLSARNPNLQNQPALEKDRYKIRQAFIASRGNALIVADYGQLELRILAHLSNCRSMLDAFKAGGDFHSRTAMNMYAHVRDAVEKNNVLLEWDPQPGEEKPPIPLLKDVFASERRKAKMLNFSIAYGKTALGLSKDWKVSLMEAKETVNLWYNERKEVLQWQEERKHEARTKQCVHTLLGRARHLPCTKSASLGQKGHIERAAINTPVQGSAADVAMCAMLEISRNARLKELGWTLVLQVHDEVILEGPAETAEEAKALVVNCMSYPFYGKNILKVDLAVDAKYASNWYEAK